MAFRAWAAAVGRVAFGLIVAGALVCSTAPAFDAGVAPGESARIVAVGRIETAEAS